LIDRFFGNRFSPSLEDKVKNLKNITGISGYKSGEKLINVLMELDANLSLGIPNAEDFTIPTYKFYSKWTEILLNSTKKLGVATQKFLRDIIAAIKEDIKFERKTRESLIGGVGQSVTMIVISWIFISMCMANGLRIDSIFYIFILISHISGLLLFMAIFNLFKKRRLSNYAILIPSLYFYKSFIEVGLSISEVIVKSNIDEVFKITGDEFKFVLLRLKSVNDNFHRGLPVKQDLEQLIQDAISLQESKFDSVNKELNLIKFVLLIIFYFIPYFLYLYGITMAIM
jgi:hypothetical protein